MTTLRLCVLAFVMLSSSQTSCFFPVERARVKESYRVVAELNDPGIVAHGVALKPGKPICLAATGGRAVVVLPGFPTSAIFTFHEFVAPVIRLLGGGGSEERTVVKAKLAVKINSEIGRTEYLLVGLVGTE